MFVFRVGPWLDCFLFSIVFGDLGCLFMGSLGRVYSSRQYLDNELRFQRVGAPWVLRVTLGWTVLDMLEPGQIEVIFLVKHELL